MRKTLIIALAAASGLALGTGIFAEEGASDVLIVYSTDERSELHPCG